MKIKGFTLIETLMAMAILASGLLLLTNTWSSSGLRMRKTQLNNEMAALLERKMTEVRIEYEGKSLESIPEEKADDFGSDFPKYSWKIISKDFQAPDFASTMTSQDGGADQMSMMVMQVFGKYLSDSIKEVKVSVLYQEGKKNLEVSATTYFINYDKEFSLPGGVPGAPANESGGGQ